MKPNEHPQAPNTDPLANRISALHARSSDHQRMVCHKHFAGYFWDKLRHTARDPEWKQWIAYFRRIRTVTYLLHTVTLIGNVLETGIAVLLGTILLFLLLPIFLCLLLLFGITAAVQAGNSNRRLKRELHGRTVYVFFGVSKTDPDLSSSFAVQNALEYSRTERCACLWISPYWISSKGLFEDRFYSTVREEAPHLFLVRRFYFFSLQRAVLKKLNTVYLY